MKTIGSMFSGGGGWEIGAIAAGFKPLWSIERDPKIAAVLETSLKKYKSHQTIRKDVRDVDPSELPQVDVLLASPVCKVHSKSMSRRKNDPEVCMREDAWSGESIIRFVSALRPRAVIIENVVDYRLHPSFKAVAKSLQEHGYQGQTAVLDACWYGVPSSRRRLISQWLLGDIPPAFREPNECVSWLDGIGDLLATFSPSHLAPWQKARVERLIEQNKTGPWPWLISSNNLSTKRFKEGAAVKVARFADEPGFTIVASSSAQSQLRVLASDGEVRLVNVRGMARLQSFPDSYKLPAERKLAITVIGNAVPPNLSRGLLEALKPYV